MLPAGSVTVNAALVVLQKYPSPATAVKPLVLTACHEVPPETSVKERLPEPSVFKIWSAEPSALGNLIPSKFNLPDPLGVNFKSILLSLPVADISGALPVAALVTVNSFTALPVSENLINSLVPSPIDCPLTSNWPPNCGVVSSTMFDNFASICVWALDDKVLIYWNSVLVQQYLKLNLYFQQML